MTLNLQDFRKWDEDDVSRWLGHISLSTLIPNFERVGIKGIDLDALDDSYMREQLRITKPAEMMALKGAISTLVDSANQPPRMKSVSRQVMQGVGERERTSSFGRGDPKTLPNMDRKGIMPSTLPRNYTVSTDRPSTREPQLMNVSAPQLLDDYCRFSGWIRKQGGGYKNWKRRYLILRLGCLYYYANETAAHPKGCFILSGYRTEMCTDPKITVRFKWTLKIIPSVTSMRTYYIAMGARRELESWKHAVDEEISACSKRPSLTLPTIPAAGNSVADGEASSEEDDEPTGPEENIYDDPDEEDDPYSEVNNPTEIIYDEPAEDDPYSKIGDGLSPPPHLSSPSHASGGLHVKNFKDVNDWELSPEVRVLGGRGGPPVVPVRSPQSLGLVDNKSGSPRAARRVSGPVLLEGGNESTYLAIIGSAPGSSSPISEEARGSSPPQLLEGPRTIVRGGHEIVLPTLGRSDEDYEDDDQLPEDEDPYDLDNDDSDTYYILFKKPEELMPPSCVFSKLDRGEADRLLRAKNRDGTYLIREGTHAGSEKVLSVWHIDRCRHYKLFKDEKVRYSLTQGQTFGTIPELLQYYALQSHLPRSDFYLGDPYHPDDH